jgi:predicted nuclease of restriction endonuclease-like (RecB) superfamily
MLYERTALSKKPDKLIEQEIQKLRLEDQLSPDLVFRDPYFLDFLGLQGAFSEKDLETAILRDLERFLVELGSDFAFLARQKRMVVDGEDFYLDLLFFHRRLRRLVAIELKLGRFAPTDIGQMEFYLRWLKKHEVRPGEEAPIGLILCAEKSDERVELLELESPGSQIAEYLTELPLVFSLVDQALDFVMSKINRRVGTRSQGPQAPVEYEMPRDAVAEAIVNAVVHRDDASNASVQVMLFSDRLEVWNPGGLIPPLTLEALRGPHPSIPRNPLLAEPMFLARYIERAGTGTLDMAALSREAGLKEPQFRFEHGQFIQVLWRLEAPTPAVTPEVTPQVTPQVVSLLKAMTGEHTREQLQDLFQLSDRENFRLGYLVPAMDDGLIERTIPDRPQSRSQRYRLTPAGQALRQRLLTPDP